MTMTREEFNKKELRKMQNLVGQVKILINSGITDVKELSEKTGKSEEMIRRALVPIKRAEMVEKKKKMV